MSIATLKQKSYTLYGTSHCNNKGEFSLNGKLRLPTPNLGRNVTRTPFKGPIPVGYGSGSVCRVSGWRSRACKHGYPIIISNSGSCTIPQTTIKRSTMNMSGLIQTQFMGILHGAPAHVHRVEKDASSYISTLTRQPCSVTPIVQSGYEEGFVKDGSRCTPYTKNETRPTYGQYMDQLTSECTIETLYKGINSCA
jgi:hypothetical protein